MSGRISVRRAVIHTERYLLWKINTNSHIGIGYFICIDENLKLLRTIDELTPSYSKYSCIYTELINAAQQLPVGSMIYSFIWSEAKLELLSATSLWEKYWGIQKVLTPYCPTRVGHEWYKFLAGALPTYHYSHFSNFVRKKSGSVF